ncbi:DedA family protein [Cytobacillus oceanisediminis]|uniref:DedA family protein n=1 Tax=Cytobacillus oceanisediminis TaxID=665099 RepID=UPI00203FC737|nr:DedA family protein [Cytobacillus oceanisediminis]MCM3400966.1 DedA family protein [Cytobacillus oceanisediminis]
MESWITSIMEQFGYIGIFLLITVENLFPPIPSEVILTFGGFMTTHTSLSVFGVVVASTIGSVAGAMVLYGIGLLIDINRIEKIIDKWGHILRLSKKDVHKANEWFTKYGVWTVFFCRFIPLIRSLISLPAGMAHMNFGVFLVLTTLGTLIWNVVLVNIGAAVGGSWETIVGYMDIYSNIVYAVIALLLLVFVILFIRKRLIFNK